MIGAQFFFSWYRVVLGQWGFSISSRWFLSSVTLDQVGFICVHSLSFSFLSRESWDMLRMAGMCWWTFLSSLLQFGVRFCLQRQWWLPPQVRTSKPAHQHSCWDCLICQGDHFVVFSAGLLLILFVNQSSDSPAYTFRPPPPLGCSWFRHVHP